MKDTVLIIVAHSDDESISMAGSIKKHVNRGDLVYAMSMTNGVGARELSGGPCIEQRRASAETASKVLGFIWAGRYEFSDNAMDSYPLIEIVKCIEKEKEKYHPSIVYTHSGADLNVDHRVVSNAVLTAFRPQPEEICKEIRLFEVASSTDYGSPTITGRFTPNLFVSISDTWESKLAALNAYTEEMRPPPHSRSIESIKNLAKLRGNQVGLDLAEAFEVIRKLEI